MKTLIVLAFLLTAATAHAQSQPWLVKDIDGWFTATKPSFEGDSLTFACHPKDTGKLMLAYVPKVPVGGQGSQAVEFVFNESVPAGRWQTEQGALVTRGHDTILDLIGRIGEAPLFTVHFERLPIASFDDAGLPEMVRGMAKACGR